MLVALFLLPGTPIRHRELTSSMQSISRGHDKGLTKPTISELAQTVHLPFSVARLLCRFDRVHYEL